MTMEEMSQCLKIGKEIEHIEEMLEAPSKTVIVFFKDYRSGIGVPRSETELVDDEAAKTQFEKMLEEAKKRLEKKVEEAEAFIESIDDPEMRMILRMYYICGMKEKEIGKELYRSRSRISQLLTGFWDEQKKRACAEQKQLKYKD